MDNTHRIVQVKGHYEVHDSNGNFVLSGDTWDECYNDLVDMLVEEARAGIEMENIIEGMSAWEKGMYTIARLSERAFWKKLSSWEKAENPFLK